MSLFSSILDSLKEKIDANTAYKQIVIQGLKEVVGVSVHPDTSMSLKDGVLTLSVAPTLKSAILLKKETLLLFLKQHDLVVMVIR